MPATAAQSRSRLSAVLTALAVCLGTLSGCTWISYLGTDPDGSRIGRTYYVGGAGPFGHVGTIEVPKGLRRAGYSGAVEVFGWQSIFGGTLRDQMDRSRNQHQARRLARRIQAYLRRYPDRRVNIIALSAGTGIAAWALEALPEDLRVGTVVFLSSSLSRDYDLGPALRRIDDKLYNFHCLSDPVLRYGLPIAGSVDRETRDPRVAGLWGFRLPDGADRAAVELYERLVNKPYRQRYRRYAYRGMHTDSTSVAFVHHVIAPLLRRPVRAVKPFDSNTPPPLRESRAGRLSGLP